MESRKKKWLSIETQTAFREGYTRDISTRLLDYFPLCCWIRIYYFIEHVQGLQKCLCQYYTEYKYYWSSTWWPEPGLTGDSAYIPGFQHGRPYFVLRHTAWGYACIDAPLLSLGISYLNMYRPIGVRLWCAKQHGRSISTSRLSYDHPSSMNSPDWNSNKEFFKFTCGRFLVDELKNLQKREVQFNMNEHAKVAADSIGASKCVSIKKYPDDMCKKAYFFFYGRWPRSCS